MTDPVSTCKAVAVIGGGAVAVECSQVFLGIPREVLYAALTGACAGLAIRDDKGEWEKFLSPGVVGWDYIKVVGRSVMLAIKVSANALICAWLSQVAQFLPLTAEAAKLVPMAVAGLLAGGSWVLGPIAIEAAKKWIARKGEGS